LKAVEQHEREADIQKWLNHLDSLDKEDAITYKRDIDFQSDYINDLIAVCLASNALNGFVANCVDYAVSAWLGLS
jgi:hypothetical protein